MIVIAAIAMVMLLAATALAFDIGREVDTNRSVQAVADAVALDAADYLDGYAPGAVVPGASGETLFQVVQAAAMQSAARNNFTVGGKSSLSVTLGNCTADATDVCNFSPVGSTNTATTVTAVQVSASTPTNFVFAAGSATSTRIATAVRSFVPGTPSIPGTTGTTGNTGSQCTTLAQCPALVGSVSQFSIGSSLATFNAASSPVLDSLLGNALHGTFSGSLVGYQGLAASQVTLGGILSSNTSLGTLNGLLSPQMTAKTFFGYVVNALQAEAPSLSGTSLTNLNAAISQLAAFDGTLSGATTFKPCQVFTYKGQNTCGLSAGATLSAVSKANFDVLSLLSGAAAIENNGHFVSSSISGLGILSVTTSVISPPSPSGVGPATTASVCPTGYQCPPAATDGQVNAAISLTTPSLVPSGLAQVANASLSLGLSVTGATSTGTLNSLACDPTGAASPNTTAGIAVSSTAVGVNLNNLTLTETNLLGLNSNINLLGSGSVSGGSSGGGTPSQLTYAGPFDAAAPAAQTTGTNNPAITVSIAGSAIAPALSGLVSDVTNLNGVLAPVLSALGVDVGAATVWDNSVDCAAPHLIG